MSGHLPQDPAQPVGEAEKDRPWYELPTLPALGALATLRNELRNKNLYDTEEPPLDEQEIPADLDPALREARTADGSFNDLRCPRMGAAGCRFGRNVPLRHVFPDAPNLLVPNPRTVSRELMTREQFQPATILNVLAAAWIQFMVHDWFVHERSETDWHKIPVPSGDNWGAADIRVPKSVPGAAPKGSELPPVYANLNSHWWDASQIYGCDAAQADQLRTKTGGRLRIEANGLLPLDPQTGIHQSGFTDNWWIGLLMLHSLFTLEHNWIADRLAEQYPKWNDEQIYQKARLINSGLMAKIQTVEWTSAILPHPAVSTAMNVNWSGLEDVDIPEIREFLRALGVGEGIPGSRADHHTVPYSLTEEFVAVYRMHPLMPDEYAFCSAVTGELLQTLPLNEITGARTPGLAARMTMPDLFYSFGTSHPGAVTLHNYPRHLQNLVGDDGERLDLAAVDILRDRERGVPRYNQFRRLVHKPPVASIDELTDNPEWRKQIRAVYDNDIELVDLMTGLYAEPLPEGFGFSETAFRVFVLMASRRLKSDRFFTDDFRPEIYTEFGIEHVRKNTMLDVLRRHYPQLEPALAGVQNAFAPWNKIPSPA
jgi:hypothetical protein